MEKDDILVSLNSISQPTPRDTSIAFFFDFAPPLEGASSGFFSIRIMTESRDRKRGSTKENVSEGRNERWGADCSKIVNRRKGQGWVDSVEGE